MTTEVLSTFFFAAAMLHSFSTGFFAGLAHKYESKKILYTILHWLAEVELVFIIWSVVFLCYWAASESAAAPVQYLRVLNVTEPLFIFCIMLVSSTRPVVTATRRVLLWISLQGASFVKINPLVAQFFTIMTVGPLLGSFITEPAAMTITALLLYRMVDKERTPQSFLYVVLAFLFVNISVGGSMTPFAAPPILMVARPWAWGLREVFFNLGIPGLLSVVFNSFVLTFFFRKKLNDYLIPLENDRYYIPNGVTATHFMTLLLLIVFSHYPQYFIPVTVAFVVFVQFTRDHQDELKFRESALVAVFLLGLIIFGNMQGWWVSKLIAELEATALFFGAAALTSITDNAALTYLGSQVPNLSEVSKWALTAGALVGGGLTIIANAPNVAGFSILSPKFEGSLNALKLLKAALIPTAVAVLTYYLYLLL
jgi:Na+/H+ antiporter NhaD/arsenite permease-like protein